MEIFSDWPSAILATFFIVLGATALVLTGIVLFKIFTKPFEDKASRQTEEEEDKKEYHWIYFFSAIVSLSIGLWKSKIMSDSLFGVVMLPVLFGAWFMIIFRRKKEQTGILFTDIFKHPLKNFGILAFFASIILLCIVFIIPMLIMVYV